MHFKVLVFPHPWGIFFLQSPQYLAKPSAQLDLKMHFRTLFWFFEQTLGVGLCILMKIELWIFFLGYYISCSQSGENVNFTSRPEFPRFCFKSIRTDEEQGKTHYHDGSLLLLNTICRHLYAVLKKNQLFLSLTSCRHLYAVLNFSSAIDRANNQSFPISSQLNRSEVPTFSPRVGHSKI